MNDQDRHRSVSLTRVGAGRFRAQNARGGTIEFGTADSDVFTPVELLLAAIGGCSGIDVDIITRRRAEPTSFTISVGADSVRDENGNHLENILVEFDVAFPRGEAGNAARAVLGEAISRSHDRLCTVSRTVELPSPVRMVPNARP